MKQKWEEALREAEAAANASWDSMCREKFNPAAFGFRRDEYVRQYVRNVLYLAN